MTRLAQIEELIALAEKAHPGTYRLASHPSSVVGWPIVSTPDGRAIGRLNHLSKGHPDADVFNAGQADIGRLIEACSPAALLPILRMVREAVSGWRPIETAPKCLAVPMKDPTRGYTVKPVYVLGFIPDDAPEHDREQGINVVWWEPLAGPGKKGCWCRDGEENILPTHWMPIPPAPTTEEG